MEVQRPTPTIRHKGIFEFGGYKLKYDYYSGKIDDYQDYYPHEFVKVGKRNDQIYGLVYPDGQVVFSSTDSHFRLDQAVKSVRGDEYEPIAQFQCMKKDCIPSYLNIPSSIRFDSIFLGVWDLNNLKRVGGFLGIDREWERQERIGMWKDSKNCFTEQVETKTKEIEQRSWEGLFSWATGVVVYDGTKVIISGSLVSISLDSVITTENEIAEGSLDTRGSFALAYDPIADKLVPGKGHNEAHGNLGYTNNRLLLISNYTDEFLSRIKFYDNHTVRIWFLFEDHKDDLSKLAEALRRHGFPEEVNVEYKLGKKSGEEEVKTTLGEILNVKK